MNVNTDLSLSRRNVLQGTGALVVAFSMADASQVLAAAPGAVTLQVQRSGAAAENASLRFDIAPLL